MLRFHLKPTESGILGEAQGLLLTGCLDKIETGLSIMGLRAPCVRIYGGIYIKWRYLGPTPEPLFQPASEGSRDVCLELGGGVGV